MSKQQSDNLCECLSQSQHLQSFWQSKKLLQNQLKFIKQENDNLKRIQQTLRLAMYQKLNKGEENMQNQKQIQKQNQKQINLASICQRAQTLQTQCISYKELYQMQLRKTSDLDLQIECEQQKKVNQIQCRILNSNSTVQKLKTQKYKNSYIQQLCSQFNAIEPIPLLSKPKNTNLFQPKQKSCKSQSCQKMDKFMKTLNIKNMQNHRQRVCSAKPSNYSFLNLKNAQKQNKKISLLIDKNAQNFINIKINESFSTKPSKYKEKSQKKNINNQRQVVLKIISDDLIKLRI